LASEQTPAACGVKAMRKIGVTALWLTWGVLAWSGCSSSVAEMGGGGTPAGGASRGGASGSESAGKGGAPGGAIPEAGAAGQAGTSDLGGSGTAGEMGTNSVGEAAAAGQSGSASEAGATGVDRLVFAAQALPPAHYNQPYRTTLTASGGVGSSYTFSTTSGALPAGVSLSESGVISGNPSAQGPALFTVTVSDGHGDTAIQSFQITVTRGRWLVYTWSEAPPGDDFPTVTQHGALLDTSGASFTPQGIDCTGYNLAFSPDGKWLGCTSGTLFDVSGASVGATLSQTFVGGVWAPDSRWTASFNFDNQPRLKFGNPLTPSVPATVDFTGLTACSGGVWSPGGALFGLTCAGTTYVVSPDWAAPIKPLLVGMGTFSGFVSDQIVAVQLATGNLGWSSVTSGTASALRDSGLAVPTSLQSNPNTERALFGGNTGKVWFDFKTGYVSPPGNYVPSPDFATVARFSMPSTDEVLDFFATAAPTVPLLASSLIVDGGAVLTAQWSADGMVFIADAEMSGTKRVTWLSPVPHSATFPQPAPPAFVSLAGDDSWLAFLAANTYTVMNLDSSAGEVTHTNQVGSTGFPNTQSFLAPSAQAFAYQTCAVQVTGSGPGAPTCIPGNAFVGSPRSSASPWIFPLPAVEWSADSNAFAIVTEGQLPMYTAGGPPFGLVVARATDAGANLQVVAATSTNAYFTSNLEHYEFQP
jgi:Putative Ig domain